MCGDGCVLEAEGGEEGGVDGRETRGTHEGAAQPRVYARDVVEVHAGQNSDWVSQLELTHADDAPTHKCQNAGAVSSEAILDCLRYSNMPKLLNRKHKSLK